MFAVLCALAGMASLLFLAEILWHRHILSGEYARKFVHILGGSFVAFWPYMMPMRTVQIIAALSILAWIATRYMHISHALRDINRPTIGELLYPISVLIVALVAAENWIFTVCILFLALADGLAAVIGRRFGTNNYSYKVFGGMKSLQGNIAYMMSCYVALGIGWLLGGHEALHFAPLVTLLWLPVVCLFAENISPYGTDNLSVPLLAVLVLNLVQTMSLL